MKNTNPSPQLSPLHKTKSNFFLQSSIESKEPNSSSPIKYLLQNNLKLNEGNEGDRGEEQIAIISSLLKECTIFGQLGISLQDPSVMKELCKGVVLIYCESPHIMDIKDNELYIFLQGQGFEYMQNNFQSQLIKKYKLYENNQYIMVHKISTNDYFLSLPENNGRYHASRKKYQLMVDQNTLLGKISNQLFTRIFLPKIIQKQKAFVAFLKKVSIFSGLPNSFFNQFSKFLMEESVQTDCRVLSKGQKSRYVYFVKSGQIQVRTYSEIKEKVGTNYYVCPAKPYNSEIISQFQAFGMEDFEMNESTTDKEVICIKDGLLYKIQKRLLAIIITSFQLQFKQKNKLWSQININNQIKGQNYCTAEQQLLLKNVERIRTSQRKARDVKLRFYANRKSNKMDEVEKKSQKMGKDKSIKDTLEQNDFQTLMNSRVLSPEEKRRMIKTTDGRFRTTSITKFINTFGGVIEQQSRYSKIKQQLQAKQIKDEKQQWVNNYQLVSLEQQNKKCVPTLFRKSNAFQYRQKIQSARYSRTLSRTSKQTQSNKFVPKLQVKANDNMGINSRYSSDLIGFYLDKKIKNEILKKAQKVMNINKNIRLTQNKNIKRLFVSKDSKAVNAISQVDKKTIASDIVERMSNMKDNPLLLQIESQRRKLERQMKLVQRQVKPISDVPRKYKKQDEHILIRNNPT